MGANPRVVTADTTFRWDGAMQRLPRGQVIDVPAGSQLEAAIGLDRLIPLGAKAAQPAPSVTDAATEAPAPPQGDGRSRKSPAKTSSNEGEGQS
jgi:hypothetical protein